MKNEAAEHFDILAHQNVYCYDADNADINTLEAEVHYERGCWNPQAPPRLSDVLEAPCLITSDSTGIRKHRAEVASKIRPVEF